MYKLNKINFKDGNFETIKTSGNKPYLQLLQSLLEKGNNDKNIGYHISIK